MKKINYKTLLSATLDNFKSDGFYREFTPIIRQVESFPLTKVKFPAVKDKPKADLKIWCTNDYLNMSHNNQVIETMVEVIREVGTGSGGTRNISGTTPFHQNLESDLAKFHNREAALIFTSAYNANQTAIWTICKAFKNICVFSDELNHASLIQGIKNSNSECKIFKHNNLEHLESLLKGTDINRPKLIVFESLYSMEGTITEVDKYVELAKRYNALTYLDEVHAVGLYGENGQGVANILNVGNKIDIIASYNAGENALIKWRNRIELEGLEFIEDIPYRETRKYVKLVSRNFFIYKRMIEGDYKIPHDFFR